MKLEDMTDTMLLVDTDRRSDFVPKGLFGEGSNEMPTPGPILIVEDDSGTLRLERFVLEEEGFGVAEATSGEEALEVLEEGGAALVLLDIGLPGMDGFTTCQRIRESYEVPIIMVTAEGKNPQIVKGLSLGADDYITKPFSTTELAARVKAVLRRYNHTVIQEGPPTTVQADSEQSDVLAEAALSVDENSGEFSAFASPKLNVYEGPIRLLVRTSGAIRGMFHFVAELRQNPHFRIMRLTSDHQAESIDISLRLREPVNVQSIILQMADVAQVIEPSEPSQGDEERVFQVFLGR